VRGEQPDLFTKRVRRPPPAPEIAVHCLIADTLRLAITPGWIWFHVPNGGWRTKAEAGKFKRMGVKVGVSDFILVAPAGARLHALELKRWGEVPTEPQNAFLELVRAAGGRAEWADSFDRAIEVLMMWGALQAKLRLKS
jgi:hypothetical protein